MGGRIVIAEVGFRLHDPAGGDPAVDPRHHDLAKQIGGDDLSRPLEKSDGQRGCPSQLLHSGFFRGRARGRFGRGAGVLSASAPAPASAGAAVVRFLRGRGARAGLSAGASGSAGPMFTSSGDSSSGGGSMLTTPM